MQGWSNLHPAQDGLKASAFKCIVLKPSNWDFLLFHQSCLCCWCQSKDMMSLEEKQSCLKFRANDHGYDNFRSSNKYSSS
ncbi:hypothetical protein lerEdw1_017070 [Lerista edwardsae]|nr:hypothetical protein lerEdw1_017070 [Lerista edwardsae]